jgi:hypothetical protein
MKCKLCERETDTDLCGYHAEAKRRLEATFRAWVDAYGSISWAEYLDRIIRNPETGQWAVDVAKLMLRSPQEGRSGQV